MENTAPIRANRAWAGLKQIDDAIHYDPIDNVRARLRSLEQKMESLERGAIDDGNCK